jgi:hypothetical protein
MSMLRMGVHHFSKTQPRGYRRRSQPDTHEFNRIFPAVTKLTVMRLSKQTTEG